MICATIEAIELSRITSIEPTLQLAYSAVHEPVARYIERIDANIMSLVALTGPVMVRKKGTGDDFTFELVGGLRSYMIALANTQMDAVPGIIVSARTQLNYSDIVIAETQMLPALILAEHSKQGLVKLGLLLSAHCPGNPLLDPSALSQIFGITIKTAKAWLTNA